MARHGVAVVEPIGVGAEGHEVAHLQAQRGGLLGAVDGRVHAQPELVPVHTLRVHRLKADACGAQRLHAGFGQQPGDDASIEPARQQHAYLHVDHQPPLHRQAQGGQHLQLLVCQPASLRRSSSSLRLKPSVRKRRVSRRPLGCTVMWWPDGSLRTPSSTVSGAGTTA